MNIEKRRTLLNTFFISQFNYCRLICRSSRPEEFFKKDALRNFAKSTGKHLCQRLFFNKVPGRRPATLFKKSLWHRHFPVNFAEILRTPFLTEHLRCLFLNMDVSQSCKKRQSKPSSRKMSKGYLHQQNVYF